MRKLKSMVSSLLLKLKSTGFMHLFGSSTLNKVLGFVSSFVLVRLIPKADYGIYANADNILALFCIFEGFGMNTTWLQYGCTEEGKRKQDIWSFCFYFSLTFQFLLCIVIAITGMFGEFGIAGTGKYLTALAFLPLVRFAGTMHRTYMRTEMMNKEYAFTNTFSTAITVAFSIALSWIFLANGLVAANYIAAFITIAFIILKYRIPAPKIKNELDAKSKKELIRFSFVSSINNGTAGLMGLIDTFILGIVIAESTVTASYKVASKIPTALFFIPTCILVYIYPYFAKNMNNKKWCISYYKKVTLLFGAFNFAVSTILIIFAPIVVVLFFGKQYSDIVPIFRILCANYAVQATFKIVPSNLLVSQKKLGFNTIINILSGLVNTGLNILLIPKYSSVGAAVATLITSMLFGFISTVFMIKVFKAIPEGEQPADDAPNEAK